LTLEHFASCIQELTPNDDESAWLSAAIKAIAPLRLLATPIDPSDGRTDLYKTIRDLAQQFEPGDMRRAERALEQMDALVTNESARRGAAKLQAPSDCANDLYTPQLDAAYFLGLAMGLRAAAVLLGRTREGV
jgi:hypothetical protein